MITIITGPPAAGKSTYARENAAAGDVIIDFDQLATALGNATPHAAAGPLREVAHVARRAAIERVMEGIDVNSWIIHSWPSVDQLENYKAAGASVVEVDPGLEATLERAAADGRPDGTDQAIRAWYANREGKAMTTTTAERHHKAIVQVLFKAEGEDDGSGSTLQPGEFIASAAVFGNVDSYGDRIVKGAFAETLAEWKASGDPIPVIWQHNWGDPEAHIGEVLAIEETDEALIYKGRIDLDEPFAAKVYKLMKGRRVTQQSFGYDVLDAREITEDGDSIFELLKVHLYEVGPCLVGVNQSTNLLDIKSSGGAAPAAPEPSGQATTPAAGGSEPSAAPPGSTQEPSASKGMSPASVMLALEISNLEMEAI